MKEAEITHLHCRYFDSSKFASCLVYQPIRNYIVNAQSIYQINHVIANDINSYAIFEGVDNNFV